MSLTAYNHVPVPSFMYGTAWKKEATAKLVQLAVESGFTAIDTANQLIHYQEVMHIRQNYPIPIIVGLSMVRRLYIKISCILYGRDGLVQRMLLNACLFQKWKIHIP